MAEKILVVDDDFEDLTRAKTILEKSGYEVFSATNGVAGFDLVKENRFDLILININMPTLSGYDLLRLLRSGPGKKTKMAYVSITPKKDVDMDSVDAFIQKPYSLEGFLKTVKSLLKRK
ncbi:MAG TPA: response regulator [Candidatus Nanoarchaeia archaeon]|nr:response regulator [Candidatus Nanoarchaeia archaeon]